MTSTSTPVGLTTAGRERLRAELKRITQQAMELDARVREEFREKDEDLNRYHTHQELAHVRGPIAELEAALNMPVKPTPSGHEGVVAVGSNVIVRDEAGEEQSLTLARRSRWMPLEASSHSHRRSARPSSGRTKVMK